MRQRNTLITEVDVNIFDQKDFLDMWVIYEHPLDFPDKYVVRKWTVMANAKPLASMEKTMHDTLEEARAAVPPGLYSLSRFVDDDLAIKEVWI